MSAFSIGRPQRIDTRDSDISGVEKKRDNSYLRPKMKQKYRKTGDVSVENTERKVESIALGCPLAITL